MPDGKTHKLVGAGTGVVYAAYRAKQQSGPNWWIEVLGGAVGGYCGGLLPDIFEPAISSWHRGVAHSCATWRRDYPNEEPNCCVGSGLPRKRGELQSSFDGTGGQHFCLRSG